MKQKFRLYRRGNSGRYYIHDDATGKQESLHTNDRPTALRLLHAKNEAVLQPAMNLQIAQVYLQHGDPAMSHRTWQHVMEQMISTKTGSTRERWEYAIKDKAFDLIRNRKLIQTSSEHFLGVLNKGSVSTNVFLRWTHNYAIGMHWQPWPVLPKLLWPPATATLPPAIRALLTALAFPNTTHGIHIMRHDAAFDKRCGFMIHTSTFQILSAAVSFLRGGTLRPLRILVFHFQPIISGKSSPQCVIYSRCSSNLLRTVC